jgi:hypothetical protein
MDLLQKQKAESVVKAHVRWFQDLRKAVETGQCGKRAASVASDEECEFGKWVHTDLRALCSRELFEQIRDIHADFHRAAASIYALALAGNQANARAALGANSELARLSRRLIEQVEKLRGQGHVEARLYGDSPDDGVGGFGAFFLLLDDPEVYRLPPDPVVPTRHAGSSWSAAIGAAGALGAGIVASFLARRR